MSTVPQMTLTPAEALLQRALLDCRQSIPVDRPGIRFAGGWVRDKLLGIPSHDIDVALSSMTGRQFGDALKKFFTEHGPRYAAEAEKLGVKANLGSLHEIMARPEQSKHLETITTKMFGFDLDFVNLRKETYAEESRNPQMEFGTPLEDAMRRDATINALFYNLETGIIEDFTKKGLQDLEGRVMRTPLPAYQTFKDDPLRVLRLIRFASRLDYDIDAEALNAMQDTTVHEALLKKISRERVGTEVGKMLKGSNPNRACRIILDNKLYGPTFACLPDGKPCPDISKLGGVLGNFRRIEKERQRASDQLDYPIQEEPQMLSYLFVMYAPWHDRGEDAISAAREAIKGDQGERKMLKVLGEAIKNRDKIVQLITDCLSGKATRSDIGMTLFRLGETWRDQLIYVMLVDFLTEPFEVATGRISSFLKMVREKDLDNAASQKLLVNGNEVQKALDVKNGKWMTKALDLIREWQFQNPKGTKEEAVETIKERKEELGLG